MVQWTERRRELHRMENLMEYLLGGMRMDRNGKKQLSKMEEKTVYGLGGMRMDRWKKK